MLVETTGTTGMGRTVLMTMIGFILACLGCQGGRPSVSGGTDGILRLGEIPLADFQVKVYRKDGREFLGRGATGLDGRFQLVNPEGTGPCWLEAGQYAFTLESFGTDAPKLSQTYSDEARTPLSFEWDGGRQSLELIVPAK
ncbi:hypothetical protein SH449x_002521 [Pirellulaceae bacterium SH449]